MKLTPLICAMAAACFTLTAWAANEKPSAAASQAAAVFPNTAPKPVAMASAPAAVVAAVKKISNGQATIDHVFKAPLGLIGLALNLGGGRNVIMYSSPDGKYMIMGGIFGPNGENYTMAAAQAYLPPPPPPPNVAKNFAALKDAKTFLWGRESAKKEIWMLADPDCIFCHKMFNELKPFVDDGTVKVHIIMAGFLKPDSLGKAAAILASQDPSKAWIDDESHFDVSTEEGGIKPDLSNAKAVATVKANNAWMQSHGIGGTPYILYLDKSGKPGVMPGFTADVKGLLDGVK